jgi:hypothetical protein
MERLHFPVPVVGDDKPRRLELKEKGADSGLQVYLVVASRSQLPAYTQWRKGRQVSWQRLPACARVWQADAKGCYEVTAEGVDRGTLTKGQGVPPLAALCRGLCAEGVVAEALAFGVRAKEEGR